MKLFEVTELLEKVSADQLKQIKAALKVYKDSKGTSSEVSNKLDGKDGDLSTGKSKNLTSFVKDAIEAVRLGNAKLNQDIDAELGKRGADPDQIHSKIYNIVLKAGRDLMKAAAEEYKLSSAKRRSVKGTIELRLNAAAYGYINKKYLGGDDTNFNIKNTKELIAKALKSQAPVGNNQPVGKVSSARPTGQTGTVPSGQGTNALDAMAKTVSPDVAKNKNVKFRDADF